MVKEQVKGLRFKSNSKLILIFAVLTTLALKCLTTLALKCSTTLALMLLGMLGYVNQLIIYACLECLVDMLIN